MRMGENPQFAPSRALLPICVPVDLNILPVNTSSCPFHAPKQPSLPFFQLKAHDLVVALLLFQVLFFFFSFPFLHLFFANVAVNQSGVRPVCRLIFLNNLLSVV